LSDLDDLIREGLKDLSEPASPAGAFERVVQGKRRRRAVRRAQTISLAATILLGSAAGLVGLARAFNLTGVFTPGDEPVVGPTVTSSPSVEASTPTPTPEGCPLQESEELPETYRRVGRAIESDVTGDGRSDRTSVFGDEGRPPRCRYFLVVEHPGGATFVAPITPIDWMPDVPSLLMTVQTDGEAGAEMVVDFGGPMHPHRTGQVFSFDDGSLVQMRTERSEVGFPMLFPLGGEFAAGVDCAGEPGTIVITVGAFADGGNDDRHYDITRTFYRAEGAVFVETREENYTVEVGTEDERWPELADDPFRSCPSD
jgi:hypothetical protein